MKPTQLAKTVIIRHFQAQTRFFKEHDGRARAVSNLSDPWIPMQSQRFIFGFPPNSKEKHDMKSECTGCNSKRSLFGHEDRKRRKASKHCEFPGPSNSPRKKGSLSSSTSGMAGLNFPNEDGLSGLEKLKNQKEWIKAARVLDRLFLTVSILIGIATLLALFLKAPRFH